MRKIKIFIFFTIIFILTLLGYALYLSNNSINIIYETKDSTLIEKIQNVILNLKIRDNKRFNVIDSFLKRYYPVIYIKEKESYEDNSDDNIFVKKYYYGVVDITDDLFFVEDRNNLNKDITFLKKESLSLYKRIVLEKNSGKPLIKNRIVYYEIKKGIFNNKVGKILTNLKEKYSKEKRLFILGFAGDFTFEYYLKKEIEINGTQNTFKEIKHILKVPDIMSVNLECVISNSDKRESKRYTFKGTEIEFRVFEDSGIDYFACANNHAMDFGEQSLLDTINILDKYGYKHSGSGRNIEEAINPAIINLDNIRLAFFSIAEVPTEMRGYEVMKHFTATDKKIGIANYNYNKELLSKKIKDEKEKKSIVVVQFHTGTEHSLEPLPYTKKWTKEIIDMGADAVICHHPHVINGVEIYNDKLIAYSLGDFLLYITNEFADEGLIIYLFLDENGIISWAFYPTACYYGRFNLDQEKLIAAGKRFIELTRKLCK
ncbi:MAG TPA: CapA family protein [Spirochaetota bacterium]|mgnify:CR=1 FL=1|nr:CapA family protein [Spirochaetota bacterium]HOL57744.1 CapA family protein [Spirochaetota bacterium]HPP05337.1 CapA family protein [Spirochaetota bacterium]